MPGSGVRMCGGISEDMCRLSVYGVMEATDAVFCYENVLKWQGIVLFQFHSEPYAVVLVERL